jgi:hypothetical protein
MADTVFTASEISRFHSKTPALREVFPEIFVPEIVFATAPSRRSLAQMSQVLLN